MEGAFETTVAAPVVESSVPTLQIWQQPIPASIALVIAVVGSVLVAGMFFQSTPEELNTARFTIGAPDGEQFNMAPDSTDLAVSPDGQKVAYLTGNGGEVSGSKSLLLRSLDNFTPVTLAEDAPLYYPFFSPDGEWVGFYDLSAGELRRVSVTGGSALDVVDLPAPLRGASWGDDDSIVYATQDGSTGLWRVSSNGGEPEQLTTPDSEQGELNHSWPQVLPGSDYVLYTAMADTADDSLIVVLSLESGEQTVVARGGFHGRYLPTGHLLYAVGNSVRAIAFDLGQLETIGSPVPIVENVSTKPLGAANFAVSDNGSLTYVPGMAAASRTGTRTNLVWVDRQGEEESLDAAPAGYQAPRISPDGSHIALQINGDNTDVMVYDIERNTTTRLTFDNSFDMEPSWSSSGDDIFFSSNRLGNPNIYRKSADGTGQVEQYTNVDERVFLDAVTPDGETLILNVNRGNWDVELMSPGSGLPVDTFEPLIATEFNEVGSAISPDGNWIAYQSDESGRDEIYVRPFPNVDGGRWQISRNGGVATRWDVDGDELFFQQPGTGDMMIVDIETTPSLRPGNPEILFSGPYRVGSALGGKSFDVSPDGERLLMLKDLEVELAGSTGRIVLVQNWVEELMERVPVP
jgi:serine/threonine-protein kinase